MSKDLKDILVQFISQFITSTTTRFVLTSYKIYIYSDKWTVQKITLLSTEITLREDFQVYMEKYGMLRFQVNLLDIL